MRAAKLRCMRRGFSAGVQVRWYYYCHLLHDSHKTFKREDRSGMCESAELSYTRDVAARSPSPLLSYHVHSIVGIREAQGLELERRQIQV